MTRVGVDMIEIPRIRAALERYGGGHEVPLLE